MKAIDSRLKKALVNSIVCLFVCLSVTHSGFVSSSMCETELASKPDCRSQKSWSQKIESPALCVERFVSFLCCRATAGTSQPHSSRGRPNAVVIHQRKAIEVLSLDTGRRLCASYPIPKDHTSLGDVNNDNVIEHVTTFFSSEPVVQSDLTPCSAVVISGGKILFRGSVCRPASTFGSYFSSTSGEDLRDESVPVAPLLVPSPSGRNGLLSHLSGVKFRRESVRGFDSVFVISSGRLTSFGPYGEFNWQVRVWINWNTARGE